MSDTIIYPQVSDDGLPLTYVPDPDKADGRPVPSAFISLSDVPNTYAASGSLVVRVKADETGLEFTSDTGATAFTQLTDCPNSYIGQEAKLVRVNSFENGLEFFTLDSLLFGAGTEAAPKCAIGTAGNGIYASAVNQLDFTTAGVRKWSITSAGVFQSPGAGVIGTATGDLTFQTGGANGNIILTLNGTGKVGIGAPIPAANLHVNYGNTIAGVAETLRLEVTGNVGTDRGPLISFYAPNDSGTSRLVAGISGTQLPTTINQGGALIFYTNTIGGSALVERSRIDNVGNVGIGTATPGSSLQVNGGVAIGYSASTVAPTNGLTIGGTTAATSSITGSLIVGNGVAATSVGIGGGVIYAGTSITAPSISITTSIFTPLIIGGTSTTQDLTLQTTTGVGAAGADMHFLVGNNGGTEAMTILNSGSVGIGTTSPETLFQVFGTVRLGSGTSSVNLTGDDAASVAFTTYQADVRSTSNGTRMAFGASNALGVSWIQGQSSAPGAQSLLLNPLGGNVGIGTTTPDTVLDVHGKVTVAVGGVAPAGIADLEIISNSASVSERPRIGLTDLAGSGQWLIQPWSASGDGNLRFVRNAGAGNVIFGEGNVGIGTTAPAKALEINSATGANLRLTYNGSANYADFSVSSGGDLTIAPSGGDTLLSGSLNLFGSVGGLITQNGGAGGLYIANSGVSTNMRLLVTDGSGASTLVLQLVNGSSSTAIVSVEPTTASTSSSTGSLINAGGFGNAGAVYIDSGAVINRALVVGLVSQSGGNLPCASVKSGSSFADFAMCIENPNVTAGQGLGLRVMAGAASNDFPFMVRNGANTTSLLTVSGLGAVNVGGTTAATSSITGSLIVGNGVAATSVGIGGGVIYAGTSITAPSISITTSIFTPLIIGGTSTTQDLTLQTTTGVGAAGADMHFLVGNNGGTEAMTILNSGSVGIGTTSPAYKLDIVDSTANGRGIQISQSGATGTVYGIVSQVVGASTANKGGFFQASGATSNYGLEISSPSSGASNWGLYVSATAQSYFAGNVGIGTTTPEGALHIVQSSAGALGPALIIDNPATSTLLNESQITFLTDSGASLAGISNARIQVINRNAGTGAVSFQINTWDGSAEAARIYINDSGNVGIGTTTPLVKVDIVDVNNANSSNLVDLGVRTSDTATIDMGGTIGLGGNYATTISPAYFGSIRGAKENSTAANYAGYLAFQTVVHGDVLTERMRITSAGNVGIGTTSPGYKLDVNGSINTAGSVLLTNAGAGAGVWRFTPVLADGNLRLAEDGIADWMSFLRTTGNVGVGTTAPQNKFVVSNGGVEGFEFSPSSGNLFTYNRVGAVFTPINIGGLTTTLNVSGVAALSIIAGGNVGIGTTAPAKTLHVYNGTLGVGIAQAILQGYEGGYGAGVSFQSVLTGGALAEMARISSDGESAWNTTAATQMAGFRFYTCDTGVVAEKVRILASGKVGIGTIAPVEKLEVAGAALITGALAAYRTSATAVDFFSGVGRFWAFGADASTAGTLKLITSSSDGSINNEALTILPSGKVGIGTTAPAVKLQVTQALDASYPTLGTAKGATFISSSTELYGLYTGINNNDGNTWMQTMRNDSAVAYNLIINPVGGNVGIGTTAPDKALEINSATGANLRLTYNDSNGGATVKADFDTNASGYLTINPSGNILAINQILANIIGSNVFQAYSTTSYSAENSYAAAFASEASRTKRVIIGYDNAIDAGCISAASTGLAWKNLVINPNGGNVGIGTTTPTGKLDVIGVAASPIYLNGAFRQAVTDTTINGSFFGINISAFSQATGAIRFVDDGLNGATSELFVVENTNASNNATAGLLNVKNSAGSVLRVQGNGNVGIGTTTPSQKLDVWDGKFILSDVDVANGMTDRFATTTFFQAEIISATEGGVNIYGVSDSDSVGARVLGIIGSTNPTDSIAALSLWGGKKNTTDAQALGATETVLDIQNWGSPLVSVLGSGNVGIGTTAPTAKLQIQTNSDVDALNMGGYDVLKWNNTSDIVFGGYNASEWAAITFHTSGSEKMRIISSGNVGIGATAPGHKLEVVGLGASGTFGAFESSSGKGVTIHPNTAAGIVSIYSAYLGGSEPKLHLSSYSDRLGAEGIHIVSGGNVGIGTATPGAKLDVLSSSSDTVPIVEAFGSVNGVEGQIALRGGSSTWYFDFKRDYNTGALSIQGNQSGANNILLAPTSGNVGIGTASPGAVLEVKNAVISTENIRIGQTANSQGIAWYSTISGAPSTERNWAILCNANAYGDFTLRVSNAQAGNPITAGTDRLSILSSGNVGIGTATPGAKLEVAGTISSTGVISTTGRGITIDNNDPYFIMTGTGTSRAASTWANAGNVGLVVGVEASVGGGAMAGTTAYATVIGSQGTNPLQLGVGTVYLTMLTGGNVGIGTTAPAKALEINSATGANLRLTYNGSANYADFSMSSGGDLTIAPSGGILNVTGNGAISGDLTVSGGNVGVGAAALAFVTGYFASETLTGTSQYGVYSSPTFTSAASAAGFSGYYVFRTAASVTMTTGAAIRIDTPAVGAANTVTTLSGLSVQNQGAAGITHAYGIDIAAQSGAATANVGLRNAGTTLLTDATASTSTTTGSLINAGGFGNAGAAYIGGVLATTGGRVKAVLAKTATYVILVTDHIIVGNHVTVAFTVTLPTLAAAGVGREFIIKNKGVAIMTVDGSGSETIDGNLTIDLSQYDSITLVNDGTQWLIT